MQSLEAVLNHPAVWRGSGCARAVIPGIPTGFPELDAALPGGGWPVSALSEIHVERTGIGELQLVMPAAARLTGAGRWVALIAPPHVPYAPALAAHGVRLSRLLVACAEEAEERLWACEQALRHRDCGAVLAWVGHAPERGFRRLQLAAEAGIAAVLLFRSTRVAPVSPAALRLHVARRQYRTVVRVLKRRGSEVPTPIVLDPRTSFPAPAAVRRQASDSRRLEAMP